MTTDRTVRTVEKGEWREIFLAELARVGIVGAACKKAGIGRSTAYKTYKDDPAFASAWDLALDDAADSMESEAIRRGTEGVDKPVYQQGVEVGTIREYSDTLLIFMLKAVRPEKFRDRSEVKRTGKVDVSKLSDDELRSIIET